MSPPCQPFTRLGNKKHEGDNRSASFLYLIGLIASVRPSYILLENVKGFELSEPWNRLIDMLESCDYDYRQYFLTPLQFGIPNCRLRFYLVARLKSHRASRGIFSTASAGTEGRERIHTVPPEDSMPLPNCECSVCTGQVRHIREPSANFTEYLPFCRPISNFLVNPNTVQDLSFLDNACLDRYFGLLDIVRQGDCKTRCFTKGYQKRIEGTGSVLQTASVELTTLEIHAQWLEKQNDPAALLTLAQSLGLRFFHSREVANLMCFPTKFEFPEKMNEKQKLRLLGNSVNVLVVAHLIHWAFGDLQTVDKVPIQ